MSNANTFTMRMRACTYSLARVTMQSKPRSTSIDHDRDIYVCRICMSLTRFTHIHLHSLTCSLPPFHTHPQVGWDAIVTIRESTSGSRADASTWWLPGGAGATAYVRISSSDSTALKAIAPGTYQPTFATVFNWASGDFGTQAGGWALGGGSAQYDLLMTLTDNTPSLYELHVAEGAFLDANGIANAGWIAAGGGTNPWGNSDSGVLQLGWVPTLSIVIDPDNTARAYTPGTWIDPALGATLVVSSSFVGVGYGTASIPMPALTVATGQVCPNSAYPMTALSSGGPDYAVGSLTYTLDVDRDTPAGSFSFTILSGAFTNGAAGLSLAKNAPATIVLKVGFRPLISVYYGAAGLSLVTDNENNAGSNPWVSRWTGDASTGGFLRVVAAPPPTIHSQGVTGLFYTAPSDVSAWSTASGGLFDPQLGVDSGALGGGISPAPSPATDLLGAGVIATTGSSSSSFIYTITMQSGGVYNIATGTRTLKLAQGALVSAVITMSDASSTYASSYATPIVLNVGFDVVPSILMDNSASNDASSFAVSTTQWCDPARNIRVQLVTRDSGLAFNAYGASASDWPTATTMFGGTAISGTTTPGSTLTVVSVPAVASTSVLTFAVTSGRDQTAQAYPFTIAMASLLDANNAGVVPPVVFNVLIGFRPMLSLYKALAGSVLITDNEANAGTNTWVSRFTDTAGNVQLFVGVPASAHTQGVSGLSTSIPAWSNAGLFTTSTQHTGSSGWTLSSSGSARTPVSATPVTSYTYTLSVSSALSGVYAVSLTQGRIANAGATAYNYGCGITLKLGFDVVLDVLSTANAVTTIRTTQWLDPTAALTVRLKTTAGGADAVRSITDPALNLVSANIQALYFSAYGGSAAAFPVASAAFTGGAATGVSDGSVSISVTGTCAGVGPAAPTALWAAYHLVTNANTAAQAYTLSLPDGSMLDEHAAGVVAISFTVRIGFAPGLSWLDSTATTINTAAVWTSGWNTVLKLVVAQPTGMSLLLRYIIEITIVLGS